MIPVYNVASKSTTNDTFQRMLETWTRVHQYKFNLVLQYNFIVGLGSLLDHIFHKLIFNESRARYDYTFHYVEVYVSKNGLYNTLVKTIQTLLNI